MTPRPQSARSRKLTSFALNALLLVVVFGGVSAYQTRNLLATDRQAAPGLRAPTLDGSVFDLAETGDRPLLVYFFAPWCPYCAASTGNINRLRRWRDENRLQIVMVALDWQDRGTIEEFNREHELSVPVVLGNAGIATDWKIYGFPTYYVLDSEQRVVSRDFGYSTQLGLWWRSWL